MDKKTIGAFIATLRKASGLTQKELAEQLNVSDKTVSRWERDDGAPDLSLIPVIAELFGVTCDELLRGERRSIEQRAVSADEMPSISLKGEKVIRNLLMSSLQRYRMQSLIFTGIALMGLIAALIANFGFMRGYIGFFLGLAFYAASAICQWIFTDRAWGVVAEEAFEDNNTTDYQWRVFRIALMAFGSQFGILFCSLPLLLSGGAYYGITVSAWLVHTFAGICIAVIMWYIIGCRIRSRLISKGTLRLSEDAKSKLDYNMKLQRRIALTASVVLAMTFAAHMLIANVWSEWRIARGQVFTDYESFKEYMAQPYEGRWEYAYAMESIDIYGNIITPEQANARQLELADGTVVCEYQHNNDTVVSINYTEKEGSLLPIEVITYSDVEIGRTWVTLRNIAFAVAYITEVSSAFAVYFRKRVK